MASKKKNDGSGIQQAAGLIRYFDEESEESWKITPAQVYLEVDSKVDVPDGHPTIGFARQVFSATRMMNPKGTLNGLTVNTCSL